MSYQIITPNDGKNDLFFIVDIHTKDTIKNRLIVHKARKLLEKLKVKRVRKTKKEAQRR